MKTFKTKEELEKMSFKALSDYQDEIINARAEDPSPEIDRASQQVCEEMYKHPEVWK